MYSVQRVIANAMTELNEVIAMAGVERHVTARMCDGFVCMVSGCHDKKSLCAGLRNAGKELLLLCGAEVGEMNAMSGCSEME